METVVAESFSDRLLQNIIFFTMYQFNSRCLNCCIWKVNKNNQGIEINEKVKERLLSDPLFEPVRRLDP